MGAAHADRTAATADLRAGTAADLHPTSANYASETCRPIQLRRRFRELAGRLVGSEERVVLVGARRLRSRTIAMQASPIGCRVGRSQRRLGAVPTRGRVAPRQLVDVPELQLQGCPPVALALVPSSGVTGRILPSRKSIFREAWWCFDAGACAIFRRRWPFTFLLLA